MKVRDAIKHLQEYNLDADFKVIGNQNCDLFFDLTCGYSDNVSKEDCEEVLLNIYTDSENSGSER